MYLTKQKTINGAIFSALRDYEYHRNCIEQLERERNMLKHQLNEANEVLRQFKGVMNYINKMK